jgi:copper homeostasis protein
VFVMIRPRPGDFLYDDGEFAAMRRDAEALRRAGADGLVTGVLRADGEVARHRGSPSWSPRQAPAPVTCHRAIDLSPQTPERALESLVDSSAWRACLTSGQANDGGARRRGDPQPRAGGRRPARGDGRCRRARRQRARAGGRDRRARSAPVGDAVRVPSAMVFRRDGVVMGATTLPDEFSRRQTDADLVARVVAAVRGA